ncbi:hypothetical protein LP419_40295 [Massilia sp. H-1]|nr:hypothetical protein LP419_40295 [Massilia sp. H-1]
MKLVTRLAERTILRVNRSAAWEVSLMKRSTAERGQTRGKLGGEGFGPLGQGAGSGQAVADRRVQFMGDARHQRTECGQPLAAAQLFMGAVERFQGAGQVAVGGGQVAVGLGQLLAVARQVGRAFAHAQLERLIELDDLFLLGLQLGVEHDLLGDRAAQIGAHFIELFRQHVQFVAAAVLEDEHAVAQIVDIEFAHEVAQLAQRAPEEALDDIEKDEPQRNGLDDRIDEDQQKTILHLLDHDPLVRIDGPAADLLHGARFALEQDGEFAAEGFFQQAVAAPHFHHAA